MKYPDPKTYFHFKTFLKYDLKASISVFFVALPLCMGVALASNAPIISGLISGIVGGIIISMISKSELSVSGPAAGLTAICAGAITDLGTLEIFFISVSIAGLMQIMLGVLRLGGFTHFVPSAVIKGMLAAIGIILISKQIPPLIGYNQPDFWSDEFINLISFRHAFSNIQHLSKQISLGAIVLSAMSFVFLFFWNRYFSKRISFLPSSFLVVTLSALLALLFNAYFPALKLQQEQFVNIPSGSIVQLKFPDLSFAYTDVRIWRYAVIICFIASLETLLSIAAIDKLDPYNRITPQNRELVAQGTGNFLTGLLGGLPITSVIVRSAANTEAGAKSRFSAFSHGVWILLAVLFAVTLLNQIPYCVLAVILIRTGYSLAKPKMIMAVYRQGWEQFMPFIVTMGAILFTDILIGVLIGITYAIYYLVKHTYRAGFTVKESAVGHTKHFKIELALNVSFLNKKRFSELLDKIPKYSEVEIIGSNSVYIDYDVLEIFQDFKTKAHNRHIQLTLKDIPDVETIELH